jgi:hypothetical protein
MLRFPHKSSPERRAIYTGRKDELETRIRKQGIVFSSYTGSGVRLAMRFIAFSVAANNRSKTGKSLLPIHVFGRRRTVI